MADTREQGLTHRKCKQNIAHCAMGGGHISALGALVPLMMDRPPPTHTHTVPGGLSEALGERRLAQCLARARTRRTLILRRKWWV